MTDNLKTRIAEAIYEELKKPMEEESGISRAAQAVIDIVEPMLEQREQHIQALMRQSPQVAPEKE